MKTVLPSELKCVVLLGVDFDGPCHEVGRGIPPLGIHSWGRYSAKRGIPRHLDMFQRMNVPCTFFVPGYDAIHHPDVVKAIDSSGCEVAAHGYLHEAWEVEFAEEEKLLRLTNDILSNLLGKPVQGWRSPSGRKSNKTMQVLHSMGYIYDSSDKDYDLPYRLRFNDVLDNPATIIELPNNTYSLDDFPFFKFSHTPPSEVLDQWRHEFDTIYNGDRFFVLTVHPRSGWGSGTPSRTKILEETIRHIQQFDGVQFFTSAQFAQWCQANPQYLEEVSHS